MKVLVTGGTGHIGSVIRRYLQDNGWDAVTVSRTGDIRADLTQTDFADRVVHAVGRCDAIVHCAANLSKGKHELSLSLVNGLGTQLVIDAASRTGARCLVYLSSLPLIGRPLQLPVDESHPANPLSAYHASKLYGEHLVRLAEQPSLKTVSLRITSPIGPGTPPGRIFSEFIGRARRDEPLVLAGQGGRKQDYVDVRDIARAVAQSIDANASGVFNLASGRAVSNRDFASRCISVLKSRSAITYSGTPDPDEDLAWVVSITKARDRLGYEPTYTLEDSIEAFAASL
jgi:nucleoside-diphosphate-sugar epimerase